MTSPHRAAPHRSLAALATWAALWMGSLPITPFVPAAVGTLEAAGGQTVQPFTVEIGGEALRISVPPTWRRLQDGATVMFAPENGHAPVGGRDQISYGIELGVKRTTRDDPSGAFEDVVQAWKSTNPALRTASITRLVKIAGRLGLRGTFSNKSVVTGRPEFVIIAAASVARDRAIYVVGLAPDEQFAAFRPAFESILLSIEKAR